MERMKIIMNPETIEAIQKLLEDDLHQKEERMMHSIVYEYATMDENIKEYRAAYKAADDFDDWARCQKEGKNEQPET